MDEERDLTATMTPDAEADRPLCDYHDKLTKLMEVLSNDMRWLVRLSKGAFGLVVTVTLLIVPFMWSQNLKLNNVEHQLSTTNEKLSQYVTSTNMRLERLELRMNELELEVATYHGVGRK